MDEVLRRVATGQLAALSTDTIEVEVLGLNEDLLNWDYGHTLETSVPVEVVEQ